MQQIQGSGAAEGLLQSETHKIAVASEPLQGNREAIPARICDLQLGRQMQTQRAHPKKRQRSIFEFAGARSQGCNAEAIANKEEDRAQADTSGKQDNKKEKLSMEQQELPQQSNVDEAHRMANWENINKSPLMKQ